jgi:alkylhydroperoxidase family enzyme
VGRKNEGLTEEQLHDMARFESSPHFTDTEKNVMRAAVSLAGAPADISNELFAALKRDLSERQLVELTAAISWENFQSRFNRMFGVEATGFSKGAFCPLPERGAAVPGPLS